MSVNVPGTNRGDEIGSITHALLYKAQRIGATIGQIRVTAVEVRDAAAESFSSTTDLSL